MIEDKKLDKTKGKAGMETWVWGPNEVIYSEKVKQQLTNMPLETPTLDYLISFSFVFRRSGCNNKLYNSFISLLEFLFWLIFLNVVSVVNKSQWTVLFVLFF